MPEPSSKADHPQKQAADPAPPATNNAAAPKELTPEEQMALYEKELKENDWGHQPC